MDGTPTWSTSDVHVLQLVPAPDGLTCKVKAGDLAGVMLPAVAVVTMTGDADLTAGVRPVVAQFSVTVTPSEAVTAIISAGQPFEDDAPADPVPEP